MNRIRAAVGLVPMQAPPQPEYNFAAVLSAGGGGGGGDVFAGHYGITG